VAGASGVAVIRGLDSIALAGGGGGGGGGRIILPFFSF
jgi:hypothetical protein